MASDLRKSPVPDMGSAGFGDKIKNEDSLAAEEDGKLGSLGPSGQEKVECVGIEKVSEMGCQSSEKIKVDEAVELRNSGCLAEEGPGKVSLHGEMNTLVSAFGGMGGLTQNVEYGADGNGNQIGGELIGACDIVKSVNMGSANDNGIESGIVVRYSDENARINEIMILDDNVKKVDKKARDRDMGDYGSESKSEVQYSSSSASESTSDSESNGESESDSSSDDDDDEGDEKGKGGSEMRGRGRTVLNGNNNVEGKMNDMEMEEGEILSSEREEIVAWSDDEYDEDDGSGVGSIGPPRSKNELTVLPPVPTVNVTLQPHHQILPVGAISSVIGAQVIVEGVDKHNPLNEGSILWITKSGSPLGVVDEIFGPVKNPYYIVRYNSESEVPAGIEPGTSISFVPEFANHVLHSKNLYQKGYDASGANDEELLDEEEFSDDEKEAEYRKMLKNKKRGKNDEKPGNHQRKDEKKFGNRSRNWKRHPTNNTQEPEGTKQQHVDPPRHMQPPNLSLNQGISSHHPGQGLAALPPFSQLTPSSGFGVFSGGANGIPFQQPQNIGLPQMPTNGMPLMPQMLPPQQLFQMPAENRFPFQQQINASPNLPASLVLTSCQPGFGSRPAFLPWTACLGQNAFMVPPFGMGTAIQQPSLPVNVGQQVAPPALLPIQLASGTINTGKEATSNILSTTINMSDSQQHIAFSSKPDASQRFNHGKHFGGGRKPHRRGGGRSRGGGRGGGQNSG